MCMVCFVQFIFLYEGQQQAFTFIPMHTKPTDAVAEMNSLVDVYDESTRYYGDVSIQFLLVVHNAKFVFLAT